MLRLSPCIVELPAHRQAASWLRQKAAHDPLYAALRRQARACITAPGPDLRLFVKVSLMFLLVRQLCDCSMPALCLRHLCALFVPASARPVLVPVWVSVVALCASYLCPHPHCARRATPPSFLRLYVPTVSQSAWPCRLRAHSGTWLTW